VAPKLEGAGAHHNTLNRPDSGESAARDVGPHYGQIVIARCLRALLQQRYADPGSAIVV
jgi:hypothetical protein